MTLFYIFIFLPKFAACSSIITVFFIFGILTVAAFRSLLILIWVSLWLVSIDCLYSRVWITFSCFFISLEILFISYPLWMIHYRDSGIWCSIILESVDFLAIICINKELTWLDWNLNCLPTEDGRWAEINISV